MRALLAILSPRRWRGQFAEASRLLSAELLPDGLGEKLDLWLDSPGWEVRNLAVKLLARARDEGRYPRLLEKVADLTEAGIVRRNAVDALVRVGLATEEARSALLGALRDPYWEVRAEAVCALAALFPPDESIERALLDLVSARPANGCRTAREENFEVRMALAQSLGHAGTSREAFAALADLAQDDSWPVRSQAAVALAHFAARLPDYHAEARQLLLGLDRQSEGALSYFVHRDILSQALRAIHKGQGAADPVEIQPLYLSPKAGWNHVRR